jgi:hypothetical protein
MDCYSQGGAVPTNELMECFGMSDGRVFPYESIYGEGNNPDGIDMFENRDPRLYENIAVPGDYWDNENMAKVHINHPNYRADGTGFLAMKYVLQKDSDRENVPPHWSLMRYAEVLLNYAEAKAELGILTDADVALAIDPIRARVGMPKMGTVPATVDPLMEKYYPNATGTQKAAILEIRRERTVELCFEGFRQWDLLRWKEGKWMTPASTAGFQGLYFPALGEYDLDGDGKMDVCLYQGT